MAAFFAIAKIGKQPRCQPLGGWIIKNVFSIHIDEIPAFLATEMNLEKGMLSAISQAQEKK